MGKTKKVKSKFVTIPNSFVRKNNLSFKSIGLFCYMFSMEDGWNFTIQSIATQTSNGLATVKSAMKELKDNGFISYEKQSDGRGVYLLNPEPKVENQLLGEDTLLEEGSRVGMRPICDLKNDGIISCEAHSDCENEHFCDDEPKVENRLLKKKPKVEKPHVGFQPVLRRPIDKNKKLLKKISEDKKRKHYFDKYNKFYKEQLMFAYDTGTEKDAANYEKVLMILHGANSVEKRMEPLLRMDNQLTFKQFLSLEEKRKVKSFSYTDTLSRMYNWTGIKNRKTIHLTFLTFIR